METPTFGVGTSERRRDYRLGYRLGTDAPICQDTCASRIPNSLAESRIEATLRGAWRLASSNEVRSHASLKGHTPLTFAGGHMVARAELNNVR